MQPKAILGIVAAVVILALAGLLIGGGIGRNDDQNWQVVQSVSGNITIKDEPGYYAKLFASVWTWPRADQIMIGQTDGDDATPDFDHVRVTFNDGGTADCAVMLRYQYPTDATKRRLLHQEFGGNKTNLQNAIYQHVVNVMKAIGPMMSSSEHQSARKGEFTQLVFDQAQAGIYQMRKVEKVLDLGVEVEETPLVDADGKPVEVPVVKTKKTTQKVLANEIVTDAPVHSLFGLPFFVPNSRLFNAKGLAA